MKLVKLFVASSNELEDDRIHLGDCVRRVNDVYEFMQDHAENTKRIAKNTLMLYGRMLFSMVVSLYTSRVVLNTLGVVDYGIYGVVGGFVAMFSHVSS